MPMLTAYCCFLSVKFFYCYFPVSFRASQALTRFIYILLFYCYHNYVVDLVFN